MDPLHPSEVTVFPTIKSLNSGVDLSSTVQGSHDCTYELSQIIALMIGCYGMNP
jgi:hypothetical protein